MKTWLPAILLLVGPSMANMLQTRQDKESTLTTDTQCFTYMCINGTIDGSVERYVLSSTGQQTPGWMAIGFGTSMTNSPMVVLWSNSDGSITLSQRQATERTMPTIVDNPPRVAVVENSLSATSGDKIQYAFTIPSSGNSSPSIIWAFSDANPGSSAKDAKIHIHIDKGTTKMNFVKAADANTTGGSHRLGTTSTNTTSSGSNDSSTLFPSSCGILAFSTLVCGLLVLI